MATTTTTQRNERSSNVRMQLKLTTKMKTHLKKRSCSTMIRNISMQHLEFPQQHQQHQQQQQPTQNHKHKHTHKRARTQTPTQVPQPSSSPFASVLALSSSSRFCHLNAFPTPKKAFGVDGRVLFFESSR
jgi:hypothetical protein